MHSLVKLKSLLQRTKISCIKNTFLYNSVNKHWNRKINYLHSFVFELVQGNYKNSKNKKEKLNKNKLLNIYNSIPFISVFLR